MRRAPETAARITAQISATGAHDTQHLEPEAYGASDDLGGQPAPGARSAGLDDQLCFALYAATNAIVRAYRPLLRAVGLTYPQYVVLMALWEADDVRVSDLGARVGMSPNGLAPIVDRLVDAELVERRRHRLDRRVVRLSLTDRGRLMEERATVAQHQVRCQTRLSSDAVDELRGSLHKLTDTLESHSPDREPVDDLVVA